jgi:hypothetical protein
MFRSKFCSSIAITFAAVLATAAPTWACTGIRVEADFDRIRDNPSGNFCLRQNIFHFDRSFQSIESFSGTFDGQGHLLVGLPTNLFNTLQGTVKNLTIGSVELNANDGFLFNGSNLFIGIVAGDLESPGLILNVGAFGTIDLRQTTTVAIAGGLVGFANSGTEIRDSQTNVKIIASPDFGIYAGGLVGRLVDGTIAGSDSRGNISKLAGATAGGIAGSAEGNALVTRTSANMILSTADGAGNTIAGGLIGLIGPAAQVQDSTASGYIYAGDASALGGFAGKNFGSVTRSVATTVLHGQGTSVIGGFIGDNSGTVSKSMSTGDANGFGPGNRIGGFFGDTSGSASECAALSRTDGLGTQLAMGGFSGETFGTALTSVSYAIGRVLGGPKEVVGGFNGVLDSGGQIASSYWTPATTEQKESHGGAPLGPQSLLTHLPPGFPHEDWRQTRGASLPYLAENVGDPHFLQAQLTAIIEPPDDDPKTNAAPAAAHWSVYVFPPLGQFDDLAYADAATHEDAAALGTVYAMLGRGIGFADGVTPLQNVTIDTYFNDATQKTIWTGAIKQHAKRGSWTQIAKSEPIGDGNVIGALRAHRAVIVSGTYDNGDGQKTHYLLATSFTDKNDGSITGLVADDPWTGHQVLIDPDSKAVSRPADFPLHGFQVTRFQTVTLD